ncbi:MAG: hypothetical protein NT094_02470, partial [Candidatus Staskawiczbacteria bacterium]|nr:hypothetical protein [Candidatus Staskawiczbacteria bacterium]
LIVTKVLRYPLELGKILFTSLSGSFKLQPTAAKACVYNEITNKTLKNILDIIAPYAPKK